MEKSNSWAHRFDRHGPQLLIAGPCVIESETHAMRMAELIREVTEAFEGKFLWTFKASFDKANRTSNSSPRGVGIGQGLEILNRIKTEFNVPVLTDIHESWQAKEAAEVVDILQIPAFLCRQTDLLVAAAKTGRVVNIKKGQFLAPWDMQNVVDKAHEAGNDQIMVCERGVSFGYNNLVSDMRSLAVMRGTGCPVVFDATHSVQQPGGKGTSSGGERKFVPFLARAAIAVGVSGLFIETHQDPDSAPSDGPNMIPITELEELLEMLVAIDKVVKE